MSLLVALALLTRLPVPAAPPADPKRAARALVWFPLVGGLLGAGLGALHLALAPALPRPLVDVLVVVALALVTGGLHLDGLMDTCDGVFSVGSPERRLAILRDPHVGSFGVIAATLVLLLKVAALGALPSERELAALIASLALARFGMALAAVVFRPARGEGLGAQFSSAAQPVHLLGAGLVALPPALLLGPAPGLAALGCAVIGTLALGRYLAAQLGGLTGDTYGAIDELLEAALLALVPLFLRLPGWS